MDVGPQLRPEDTGKMWVPPPPALEQSACRPAVSRLKMWATPWVFPSHSPPTVEEAAPVLGALITQVKSLTEGRKPGTE